MASKTTNKRSNVQFCKQHIVSQQARKLLFHRLLVIFRMNVRQRWL